MEQLLEILKGFIIEHSEYFTELATEDCPMYAVTEADVLIRPADLSRNENDLLCVILPETEEEDFEDSTIKFERVQTQFRIGFVNRGYSLETLIKQSCRYAAGFRQMLFDNPTLDDQVVDFEIGTRTFYPDSGTVEEQMSAVEIELTLYTENEIN